MAVTTAPENSAIALAASPHMVQLAQVKLAGCTRAVEAAPLERTTRGDMDEQPHVVEGKEPPPEPTAHHGASGLAVEHRLRERGEVAVGQHVGEDAVGNRGVALNEYCARFADARAGRFGE